MISMIYKSKLLREELKHWAALAALFLWGTTATVVAISRREKIVIIGVDDAGTRLITEQSDRLLKEEIKSFLKYFFEMYFSYNDVNFNERMSLATDLFSESLWQSEKPKIIQIGENIKKTPLAQTAEVISIDKLESNEIEAVLRLHIKSRMSEQVVNLKVKLEYRKTSRTERNPWSYEITSLNDSVF